KPPGGRSGRLNKRPASYSLGLLPSGPDPVGEGHVRRQPPGGIMVGAAANYNPPGAELKARRRHRSREIVCACARRVLALSFRPLAAAGVGSGAAGYGPALPPSQSLASGVRHEKELGNADRRFDDNARSARTEAERRGIHQGETGGAGIPVFTAG